MTDLTLRLRNKADMIEMGEKIQWGSDSEIMREAAARIAELEAALKPFADMTNYLDEPDDGETCGYAINCADLRAARAAYLGEKE
jgi:hypothetical protein